jgi:hypothetical protein
MPRMVNRTEGVNDYPPAGFLVSKIGASKPAGGFCFDYISFAPFWC